jgi:hypothetical protein
MSLPGFTAENTLAGAGVGYRAAASASTGADGIVPQRYYYCDYEWVTDCYWDYIHNQRVCCYYGRLISGPWYCYPYYCPGPYSGGCC